MVVRQSEYSSSVGRPSSLRRKRRREFVRRCPTMTTTTILYIIVLVVLQVTFFVQANDDHDVSSSKEFINNHGIARENMFTTPVELWIENKEESDLAIGMLDSNYNISPTLSPTAVPTEELTLSPTSESLSEDEPTIAPSVYPILELTDEPTMAPSFLSTVEPTASPSMAPSLLFIEEPTVSPTIAPSSQSSSSSSGNDDNSSSAPTQFPSAVEESTTIPTQFPSEMPTLASTDSPTEVPTALPTADPSEHPSASPSDLPTAEPTIAPTFQVSETPSEVPTASPSTTPTEFPTFHPSDAPTAYPSEGPTESPTLSPTELPSLSPSVVPSWNPSAAPTATPTAAPTLIPTLKPTTVSTNVPSMAPSTPPSVSPSIAPTASPTAAPTVSPTVAPVIQPTQAPTSPPTISPTIAPTVSPTMSPTALPTVIPTDSPFVAFTPTFPPTAAPTAFNPICSVGNNTATLLQLVGDVSSTTISYFAGNVSSLAASSFLTSKKSSYTLWNNFTSAIQQLDVDGVPSSVTLQQYVVGCGDHAYSNAVVSMTFTCSEFLDVNLIWQYIVANRPFVSSCGTDRWVGRVCAIDSIGGSLQSSYQICVNCANPCQLSTYSSDLVSQLHGLSSLQYLSVVGFHVQRAKQMWPSWEQRVCTVSDTSIKVKYSVAGAGRIYCAALPVTVPIYSPRTIQTYPNVILKFANTSATGEEDMTITGLLPDTSYNLACFTRSIVRSFADQYRAPLQAVLERVTGFRTAATEFPFFSVSLPFKSVTVNEVSSQIDVSLSYLLRANTTIYPLLRYYGEQPCPSNVSQWNGSNRDYEEVSSDASIGAVAPSALSFSSMAGFDQTSLVNVNNVKNLPHGYFYVQTKSKGCYGLVFRFAAADKYRFVTSLSSSIALMSSSAGSTDANGDIPVSQGVLLINSTSARDVTLSSAIFSPNGLDFTIRFSADTDMGDSIGLYSSAFQCNRIFVFNGSSNCDCQFTSSATVLVTPSSMSASSDLPVPGNVVTLKENVLKSRCSSTNLDNADCGDKLYLLPSSVLLQRDPLSSVSLQAVVTSPVQVSVGDNITMSIAASLGNGGRPWKSITWRVFYNFTTNDVSQRIMDYMNDKANIVWQNCLPKSRGCDTLPGEMFMVPGDYSFELKLENFLGVSATYSKTIYVIPKLFVPRVWIVGQYYREVPANMSHLLRAELSDEDSCRASSSTVDGTTSDNSYSLHTSSGLAIKWSIYKDDVLDSSIIKADNQHSSYYHDDRSLFIEKNTLIPGHEYRIGVTVFCGSYFAYDEAIRYISANDILPSIKNGDAITIGLQDPLILDASASRKVFYDQIDDLQFTWNCLQLSPLRSDGCDDFYEALLTLSSSMSSGDSSGSVVSTNVGKVSYSNGVTYGSTSSSGAMVGSLAMLRFEEPWKIFNPSAKYLISVSVASASLGISREGRQLITTLPMVIDRSTKTVVSSALPITPRLSLMVPSFTVNNSFGYTLNATISSDASFIAEWQMVGLNDTLASRIFLNGGAQVFAAILPNSLIMSTKAKFYQFRLVAFPIVGGDSENSQLCLSSLCANSSSLVSTMFTVAANKPPAYGSLSVSPYEGIDSITAFSLFALNWHDDDLPIFYSFYRWNEFSHDFDLIRQRMQINTMQTKLHAPLVSNGSTSSGNYRVPLRVLVSDYYSATTQVETPVNVLPQSQKVSLSAGSSGSATSAMMLVVDNLVTSIDSATREIQSQSNPEIILPLTSTSINQLNSLRCDSQALSQCQSLIEANAKALKNAAVKYNAGFFTLSGISLYLSQLIDQYDSNLNANSVNDMFSVYQFIGKTLQSVGFSQGDGTKLVNTLTTISERLVDKYSEFITVEMNTKAASIGVSSSTHGELLSTDDYVSNNAFLSPSVNSTLFNDLTTVHEVYDIIHTVHRLFFDVLPFGYRQQVASGDHFNVTMTKGYWDGQHTLADHLTDVTISTVSNSQFENNASSSAVGYDNNGLVLFAIEDLLFSAPILPRNATSSYTLLSSVASLPRCFNVTLTTESNDTISTTGPCVQSAQSMNVDLSIFRAVPLTEAVDMYLSFKELNRSMFMTSADSSLPLATATLISTPSPSSQRRLSSVDSTSTSNATQDYVGQYAIFRNCSDFAATVANRPQIICSSEMTNGPIYVFSNDFVCSSDKLDHVVMFVCPVYHEEVICLRDGIAQSYGVTAATSVNETEITCVYPVHQILSSSPSAIEYSTGVISSRISGSFSYSYAYSTAITASIDLLPPNVPIDDKKSSSSKSSTINYIAIVVIGVAAILFALFLYNRTKTVKETVIPDVMPAAETEAHYVDLPITEAINHEVIIGTATPEESNTAIVDMSSNETSSNDVFVSLADQYPDLEAGSSSEVPVVETQAQAEMVKFDAVAFPVLL